MTDLTYPFAEATVRGLAAGDAVRVRGRVFLARDRVHRFLHDGGASPVPLRDGAIYHCGPVVVPDGAGGWRVVAAGPTTSNREDPYMPGILAAHGPRLILGKGGMAAATVEACQRFGCVYVQVAGGAAASLARTVRTVRAVYFLDEFGATEALWDVDVEDLEGIVGIDATGHSLFDDVRRESRRRLDALLDTSTRAGLQSV
jgi:fumarate hydratase class I